MHQIENSQLREILQRRNTKNSDKLCRQNSRWWHLFEFDRNWDQSWRFQTFVSKLLFDLSEKKQRQKKTFSTFFESVICRNFNELKCKIDSHEVKGCHGLKAAPSRLKGQGLTFYETRRNFSEFISWLLKK